MSQQRLDGTLPAPPLARKNHKLAVAKEREAQKVVDRLALALKEAKAILKSAAEERRRTEDDLEAAEANDRAK